jgi:hypothetical protein
VLGLGLIVQSVLRSLCLKRLQHLVTIVVDNFHGDLARVGPVERAAHRAVETAPGRFIDVGPERPLELVIGFVGPGEVGVPHEEALAVVVGVDEPAGDVITS